MKNAGKDEEVFEFRAVHLTVSYGKAFRPCSKVLLVLDLTGQNAVICLTLSRSGFTEGGVLKS
jgi:hypothetical protein